MSHHWKVLSSETRDLTPDLAAEFSGMPASTTERDVSEKRVKHLRTTRFLAVMRSSSIGQKRRSSKPAQPFELMVSIAQECWRRSTGIFPKG